MLKIILLKWLSKIKLVIMFNSLMDENQLEKLGDEIDKNFMDELKEGEN